MFVLTVVLFLFQICIQKKSSSQHRFSRNKRVASKTYLNVVLTARFHHSTKKAFVFRGKCEVDIVIHFLFYRCSNRLCQLISIFTALEFPMLFFICNHMYINKCTDRSLLSHFSELSRHTTADCINLRKFQNFVGIKNLQSFGRQNRTPYVKFSNFIEHF
jgi:hypothetical protein